MAEAGEGRRAGADPAAHIEAFVGALIERWLVATDSFARDRILLEAAQSETECAAAALWRAGARGWRALVERGPVDALPRAELVDALLAGRLSADLLPSGMALVHPAGCALALVLGGLPLARELELLEAVLWVREAMEGEGAIDREAPPTASST